MRITYYWVSLRLAPDFLKLVVIAYVCAILTGMQPELSSGPRSIEQNPIPQAESYEVLPNLASPETLQTASPERIEQRSAIELAPPPPPAAPMMPPVAQPALDPATSTVVADDQASTNPVAANDDDVIEKEWVDRAKQVILQTRDNPFAREKAIGELQRDYLMKRYGRQVGASND